eukprot:13938862-Heterocapsa_arctica.AAC.2
MAEQVFDRGRLEQEVISVLYSHSTKWGNLPNHHDLLVPHVEVEGPTIRMHDGYYDKKNNEENKQ